MGKKKSAGGVAIWAVNPTPDPHNASVYCKNTANAMNDILKPKWVYGTAPNYTMTVNGWWPSGSIKKTCGITAIPKGPCSLNLACPGDTINKVTWAHYGTPKGDCDSGFQADET